jgi:hypothetical protein
MALTRWPVAAVLALVVVAGCTDSGSGYGTDPAPPTSSSTPAAATAPVTPVDSSGWTTYTSAQYGFEIGHPPDWTAIPAGREWAAADVGDPLGSLSHDTFHSPDDDIRVSVWQVPLEPGTTIESREDFVAWAEEYCEESGSAPCGGIDDRAVDLCLEKWDCHPGLLVPFSSDVQGYFTAGIYPGNAMTVVAVWRGESAPAASAYGGSSRLLAGFLSTMQVWPASVPREERYCYGGPPAPPMDCHGDS